MGSEKMEPQSSQRTQRKDLVGFIFGEIKGMKKKGKADLSKIVGIFVKGNGVYCRKVTIGLISGSKSNHRSGFCCNTRLGCAWMWIMSIRRSWIEFDVFLRKVD